MRAFVTGGSGHVGGNLVRELISRGYGVKCLVRKDTRALDGLDVELVQGDLNDASAMGAHMQDVDMVFHAAAFVAVERVDESLMERINVGGTRAMCEAALSASVGRFIHFSSVHAFSQMPTDRPLTEDRALVSDPDAAPYDRTKAAAQRVVMGACDSGLNASIIHPTGIIGPNDWKPSRMGAVIQDIATGQMPIILRTGFNWVDVRDVCRTAVNCVEMGRKGQNYLAPGSWGSMKDISDAASEVVGKKTTYLQLPLWSAYLALPFAGISSALTGNRSSLNKGSLHALDVQCRDIPGVLAKEELRHASRPLAETVRDTIDWMRSNDRL